MNTTGHLRQAVALLFLAVLGFSLAYSMAIRTGHADVPIASNAEEIQPLQAGDPAPQFAVRDVKGREIMFDPSELERPVVLVTFRGGWCPYCNLHLSELRHVLPELKEQGIDVYFLSGDRPELLYKSLDPEAQGVAMELDYTLLSDADASAAIALGIAFRAPGWIAPAIRVKGNDVDGSSLDNHGILPVPSVFAINREGQIEYAYTNADYKVRLSPEELLEVTQSL